MALFQIF